MVTLVHKNVKHIWDVKGKRFCHPGFNTVNDWTKAFSMVGVSLTRHSLKLYFFKVAQNFAYRFSISKIG